MAVLKKLKFPDDQIELACETGKVSSEVMQRLTESDKILLKFRLMDREKDIDF